MSVHDVDQEAGGGDSSKRDFPYYNGHPVWVSGAGWWFVFAAVLVAFALLVTPIPFFKGTPAGELIPALLFMVVPLAALWFVAKGKIGALFGKVGVREILWAVLFGILNLLVTVVVAALVMEQTDANRNPAVEYLANASVLERVLFFVKTIPQLLGEELLTILPFLGLLYYFRQKLKWSRKGAVIAAWLITALFFGAMHLPTYQWNVLQCLGVIGMARVMLSLAYIVTKNIWVSFGAHVLTDWVIFGIGLLGIGAANG